MRVRLIRTTLTTTLFLLVAAAAFAQATTVRVTGNRVSIWRSGLLTVATIVDQGTVLEVVARRGTWLEVILPGIAGREEGQTGLIAIAQVELVSGSLPTDQAPAPPRPRSGVPGQAAIVSRAAAVDTGLRGFFDAGLMSFLASETFKAILDRSQAPFIGGGVEFRTRERVFAQASVRWFRDTGERVFVDDDEAFRLGIRDTVTILPIGITGGYRFRGNRMIPYLGGGAGTYIFRETSAFADASENIEHSYASYHALGGVEWRGRSSVAVAVEAQFTHVPKALDGPAAESFEEHNLGGFEFRVKVVFGR
jgi:hypothetical protein